MNHPPSIRDSVSEYGRGVAGGLLFSLPLIYTEEVWQRGATVQPVQLLGALLFTFILLLGYNRYAGLRRDANWGEVAIDSVEELGLGILIAALLLWLLGRVDLSMGLRQWSGRVLVEAMVVAVGVSVGTAQLGAKEEGSLERGTQKRGVQAQSSNQGTAEVVKTSGLAAQVVLGTCGAFLIVSSVAPTIEIVLIGSQVTPGKLLLLVLLTLTLAAGILYFSNFIGSRRSQEPLIWRTVALGVSVTYAVALFTAACVLWFFGRFDGAAPQVILAYVITAGLPAALGASAGRLLLEA